MNARHRARLRAWAGPLVFFIFVFLVLRHSILSPARSVDHHADMAPKRHDNYHNLLFTEAQCKDIFPDLTGQLEEIRAQGTFELPFRNRVVLQGKIENGEVSPVPIRQRSSIIHPLPP